MMSRLIRWVIAMPVIDPFEAPDATGRNRTVA